MKNVLVNDLHDSDSISKLLSTNGNYLEEELSTIRDVCITHHNSIDCTGKYKVVVGTAWMLKPLHQIANSYGEVILIYSTKDVNKEECPLLAISTRPSINNYVAIFHAVLPNNQRW
eukprot:374561-Ditylum_brightwellii.AAC.1